MRKYIILPATLVMFSSFAMPPQRDGKTLSGEGTLIAGVGAAVSKHPVVQTGAAICAYAANKWDGICDDGRRTLQYAADQNNWNYQQRMQANQQYEQITHGYGGRLPFNPANGRVQY